MYKRREGGRLAKLGNYLYWDGGKISRCVDNKCPSSSSTEALNGTQSIPLNSDWTNSTVSIKESRYPDELPLSSYFSLWADEESSTMYRWGGERLDLGANESVQDLTPMWAFKADGNGGGEWLVQEPAGGSKIQDELNRNYNGVGTVCGRTGYYLGGGISNKSTVFETEVSGGYPVGGLIRYDLATHTWKDNTTTSEPFPELGWHKWGEAHCLEDFLTQPLVLFLGGAENQNGLDWTEVDLGSVTLYDPSTNKWHKQKTTPSAIGGMPPSRFNFCSVGARGKNNTYEIFVYGGRTEQFTLYGDVWALSLPGFVWAQLSATDAYTARWSHQCALAGNSQMISMGGASRKISEMWKDDTRAQTLGVFDLVEQTWKSSYNASAGDYDTPKALQNWYQRGTEAQWNSDEVKAYFATSNITPYIGGNTNNTDNTGTNGTDTQSGSQDSKGPNVSAIVGGVVGGVVFLALAAVAVWFLLFRRKKEPSHSRLAEITENDGGYNASRYELGGSTLAPLSGRLSGGGFSGKVTNPEYELDGVPLRPQKLGTSSPSNSWTWSWVPSIRPKIASPRTFPPSPAELNG